MATRGYLNNTNLTSFSARESDILPHSSKFNVTVATGLIQKTVSIRQKFVYGNGINKPTMKTTMRDIINMPTLISSFPPIRPLASLHSSTEGE